MVQTSGKYLTDDDTGERAAISEFMKEATEKNWNTSHIEFREKEKTDKEEREAMLHPVVDTDIQTYYGGTNLND